MLGLKYPCEDVRNPPPGCPTVGPESLNLGIMSFAAIPLTRLGEIVGVLFVNSQKALNGVPSSEIFVIGVKPRCHLPSHRWF